MKKVLLCERDTAGHRKMYLKWLADLSDEEMYVYAPENVGADSQHFFELQQMPKRMTMGQYWRWNLSIHRIVRDHRIHGNLVENDLDAFKARSQVIVANRLEDCLCNAAEKVYTRDLFARD